MPLILIDKDASEMNVLVTAKEAVLEQEAYVEPRWNTLCSGISKRRLKITIRACEPMNGEPP